MPVHYKLIRMTPRAGTLEARPKVVELPCRNMADNSQNHLKVCKVPLVDLALEDAMGLDCTHSILLFQSMQQQNTHSVSHKAKSWL